LLPPARRPPPSAAPESKERPASRGARLPRRLEPLLRPARTRPARTRPARSTSDPSPQQLQSPPLGAIAPPGENHLGSASTQAPSTQAPATAPESTVAPAPRTKLAVALPCSNDAPPPPPPTQLPAYHRPKVSIHRRIRSYLRKRVLKLVFLSQFPYKFVNLFFTLRIS